jgi:two-component sensor histidine kinase
MYGAPGVVAISSLSFRPSASLGSDLIRRAKCRPLLLDGRSIMKKLFDSVREPRSLAQAIVKVCREPLLALDGNLNILFASDSFCQSFELTPESTKNRRLASLDNGAWDIPAMRALLETVLAEQSVIEGVEIVHEFPRIGLRIFRLHAQIVPYEGESRTTVLLGFEDVTERRAIEQQKDHLLKRTDDLLHQKEMLLEEMQHRIINSLQIVASILMLKSRAVTSDETRQHLQDAHRRVMSVAVVQRHLQGSARGDLIEVAPYLTKLCDSIAESMIGDSSRTVLDVVADKGAVKSADIVSLGLIVTELVINALKYALPDRNETATVKVHYEMHGTDWKLSVSDNGVGKPHGGPAAKGGLGTSLVNALADQLDAEVESTRGPEGMRVTITHATFMSQSQQTA